MCSPETWLLVYKYTCAARGFCKIFGTPALSAGATFSGVSGADQICNADPDRPSVLTSFKAFIASGATRRATVTSNIGDGQVDWVLMPSTQYRKPDGTIIGSTGANSLFVFNLTNPASATTYWTGMNTSWQSAADCSGWTNIGSTALVGNGANTTTAMISAAGVNCNVTNMGLLCIEQ